MFFMMITIYLFALVLTHKCSSVHAYCPYAVICFGLLKIPMMGSMLFVYTGAIIFGLLMGIITMFIGRKFCGYICPIGTIQGLIFKLRTDKYIRKKRIPFFYEYKFRKIIYFIFALTVVLVIIKRSALYMLFCPVQTIGILPKIYISGILIWIVILVGSFFTERFWCRFLCPYAALLNLFQMLSKLFGFKRLMIKRNLEKCVDCCNCIKHCPMNIDLQQGEYITDLNCIHCMKCAVSCPKPNTINEEMTKRDCYE